MENLSSLERSLVEVLGKFIYYQLNTSRVRDSQCLIFDNAGHKNWKWSIINSLLNARYREEISSIAMVHRGEDNTRVWKYNNKDMYTVKYECLFAMETLIDNEKYQIPSDWGKLWRLKIPQRVKILLWRVVKGFLSTRDIFQRKGVQCTNACPFCENRYENLFLECEKASEVQTTADLWSQINSLMLNVFDFVSFSSLFFQTCNHTK